MKGLKIIGTLAIIYLLSWFLLAVVGLSNDRTDTLLSFGEGLMLFISHILGFPLNLVNDEYPFLMDHTGKMIESEAHPIVLIVLNFILQVIIIYGLMKRKKLFH
jgi:hypothetical protein